MRQTAIEKRAPGGKPGNTNAVKHGLYSRDRNALKLRARAVRRLVDKAYSVCPWLTPTDLQTVRSWAETVKLKAVCFAALEQSTPYRIEDGDIVGRKLLSDYNRLANIELAYSKELGFTPQARMSLGIKAMEGGDLAAAMAEHRNGASND